MGDHFPLFENNRVPSYSVCSDPRRTAMPKDGIYEVCSKKRPNFLNCVPSSTEGTLRLLAWSDGKQTVLPGSFSAFE